MDICYLKVDCLRFPGMRFLLILLFVIAFLPGFSQFSAGVSDTINPGVPVNLNANFGILANEVDMQDNQVKGPFNIGFPFRFYGTVYSRFVIGENGWISFESSPALYNYWGATRNIRLPSADAKSPKTAILGAMEDYNPGATGGPYIFYQTIGQPPNRKLVVMWCQCPMFGCTSSFVTFQIVLKEGDTIETHLFSKPMCTSWDNKCTIGLQNEFGIRCDTLPNKIRNSTSWSATEEGWRFVPASADNYTVTQIPYHMEPISPGDKISYRWYAGSEYMTDQQNIVVTPNETTVYKAVCNLCSGVEFTSYVTVVVVPYIPNAFTPNGDGLNDSFKILGLPPENITKFNLQIYNRWGQIVFSTNNILNGWDGTLNGEYCPEGYYTWVIFYEDNNRNKNSNKGSLLLLR